MSYSSLSSVPLSRDASDISIHISNDSSPLLDGALNTVHLVLSTQSKAIAYLANQYRKSDWSRQQMKRALRVMNNGLNAGGKIVVSGIGKSYKIAAKTVATLNSLSVQAALLHPSEALHGDLGIIREERGDVLVLISASGNTAELINLLQYVPECVPVILMSCSRQSQLSRNPRVLAMLYAELPKRLAEKNLYGLSAPTISTTLCLTLLDATSMALAELYMNDLSLRKKRFGDRHPGGAIGAETMKDRAMAFAQLQSSEPASTSASNSLSNSSGDYPEKSVSETSEELAEEDALTMADLVLLNKIRTSNNRVTLRALPENDELEMATLMITYDYILIQGDENEKDDQASSKTHITHALDSKAAQEIYRSSKLQGDDWQETRWKLEEALLEVSM
ncbi:DEKNAAC104891 [Brettanomyces naardenensis]|uniref:DEKNAAC104891 n=1 Tax=Brettanomyces naardenensis TaxID=13370 RepID=A0A448YSD2_BRENA|nr:DEKNAAC104891 [Brettanomyces naardenensis]